ncbi:MAG: PfkB family carbohydrate kinase [Treponema sp.]|jgi:bifunctional ADP-heptose synthase (sugar kinase/adenylyltransferase)/phosphoglycolate phosphatase-like HAD superfamily hydrolase|nr:PfkB family carbohydrate kinase [Treponema sp.]
MNIDNFLPYKNPPAVAIIGDICLDLYYFAGKDGAELSVETGLQTFSVYKSRQDLGAAGNVAANCASLGAKSVDLYGLTGNDPWGKTARDLMDNCGINHEGVLTQEENWQTHVYHKILLGGDELPRYDMGNQNIPLNEKVDALISLLESRLDKYQCVIINEQVPSGLHSPYFQKKLAALVEKSRSSGKTLWFSDCRRLNDNYAHTIRKLNISEAREILHSDCDAVSAAEQLYRKWNMPVVLTLGEEGALIYDQNGSREINSLHFIREIDIVGAGDAFLAGLVTALGAGLSIYDGAIIGTFSAGVSLGKLFETGRPTVCEVLALAAEGDFNYNPRLARDESLARIVDGTEIEVTGELKPMKGFPRAVIFDHDGTISVLRQGWEEVMRDIMFDAVTGAITKTGKKSAVPNRTDMDRARSAVSALIEKTTGVQTLTQMYQLKELVLSFGYVKPEEALSPEEYKAIYNKALIAGMEQRLRGIKENRLNQDDVTIKGAVAFLKKLSAAGTKLYLASGTDEEDVKREAELLGYAGLFDEGIRGSVGDIKNDPKKLVIRNIIAGLDIGSSASRQGIAVFGDGPVEMREAKKAGLLAVGILSDERRRYGRNRDKRERLILGGADILIPDFSCEHELCRLCGWE